MSQPLPATRVRRGGLALVLAAILGGSVFLPTAASAEANTQNVPAVPTASLVSTGDTWKYLDDASDPARGDVNLQAWTAAGYDDTSWKSAASGFGVKSNQLVKVGPYLPATKLEHYIDGVKAPTIPTYFFRTSFTLESGIAEQVASLAATVTYDDALVVYINGEKVASYEDARITGTTNQEYAGSGKGDPQQNTFTAPGTVLQDGVNTVAVQLHQDRETSSDAYFDLTDLKLTAAGQPGGVVEAAPTRVILTPTETPETSQSFSWLAGDASHATGQVEIAQVGGLETTTVDAYSAGVVNGNPKHHFSATVTGLVPATAYQYRVGLPGSWSDWFTFTTADPSATDFQFIYYGDAQIGLDTTWPKVVEQAEARAPQSVGSVHAGDLIDSANNETQWLNWFAGMETSATRSNVMAAPGNHEYTGDKLMTAWKANFEYPHNQPTTETVGELAQLAQGDSDVARQYAAYFEHWGKFAAETVYFTDYQGVRFITLNATRDTTFLTPDALPACSGDACPVTKRAELWTEFQVAWLDFILEENPSQWSVVTFHQPVFSTSAGRDEPVLRKHWVPVFEKHDVDLVLMGHDHTYARGFVNETQTDVPGITSGPVYAVSNSGAKHYALADAADNVWTRNGATQVLRGENVTTYQVIDVSSNQLVYRSYLAEKANGATTDKNVGDLYDEVTVTKYATGAKYVTEAGVDIPAGPELTLSAPSVTAGGTVTLVGSGFTPESTLALELRSEPVSLGNLTVAADGTFAADVVIPAATAAGEHSLVVTLPNGAEIATPVTVAAAEVPGGPGTPGEPEVPVTPVDPVDPVTPGEPVVPGDSGQPSAQPAGSGQATGLAQTGGELLPIGLIGATLLLLGVAGVLVGRRVLTSRAAGAETAAESDGRSGAGGA